MVLVALRRMLHMSQVSAVSHSLCVNQLESKVDPHISLLHSYRQLVDGRHPQVHHLPAQYPYSSCA